MKTKSIRMKLLKIFGYESWPDFKKHLKEAKEPFPVTVDWRCMALARQIDGETCAFGERIGRMEDVDKCFVTEHFTYIRFDGSETIFRYNNSLEMRHQIKTLDATGMFDDMEEGEVFILEAVGVARSHEYAEDRRKKIKDGTWIVKPRGPNPNMRREPIHKFRPY